MENHLSNFAVCKPKFNAVVLAPTFPQTFRKIGAIPFEISWRQANKQMTNKQTEVNSPVGASQVTLFLFKVTLFLFKVTLPISLLQKIYNTCCHDYSSYCAPFNFSQ